jgi:hypothetical protein
VRAHTTVSQIATPSGAGIHVHVDDVYNMYAAMARIIGPVPMRAR